MKYPIVFTLLLFHLLALNHTKASNSAMSGFLAYNDLSWGTGQLLQNITRYTTGSGVGVPIEGSSGVLIDYITGFPTGVELSIQGGNWNGSTHTQLGDLSRQGTDAYEVFHGVVDTKGVISYGAEPIELKLSGLNPALRYRLTVYGNRDQPTYENRLSKSTLIGAESYVNISTTTSFFHGPDDAFTVIANGYNTLEGEVARFTQIKSGDDGLIQLIQSNDGTTENPQFYINALCLEALEPSTTVFTPIQISRSQDDAEEKVITGSVNLRSTDLEMTQDRDSVQVVGLRFEPIPIPQGVALQHATIQFTVDEVSSLETELHITAQAADNASSFSSQDHDLSSRAVTTETISWQPQAWSTIGEHGLHQQTPNIAPILQEVLDREGWEKGNALVVFISGPGRRTAESFDGQASSAPVLNLHYKAEPVLDEGNAFIAYNDLSWGPSQRVDNITRYTTREATPCPPFGSSGRLMEYLTGQYTPVTLSVEGGRWDSRQASRGSNADETTDAYKAFHGFVDATGIISYGHADILLTLEHLNPSLRYDVTLFGNRDRENYVERKTAYLLRGATFFLNTSSENTDFVDENDPEVVIRNGYNTRTGHVAEFSEIAAGDDGEIQLLINDGGSPRPFRNYVNAIKVVARAPVSSEEASYRVVFNSTWSRDTHPEDFPFGPHFSGLVGATHDSSVVYWEPQQNASLGVQHVAEFGSKSAFIREINATIQEGMAETLLSGSGISRSPGNAVLHFTLSRSFPLVTLISMIAPSPDWFVGVHGLSLFENGQWQTQVRVPLFAYDAGTDSGTRYTSSNQVTLPVEKIHLLTTSPFLVNGEIPSLGTFIFDRVDE